MKESFSLYIEQNNSGKVHLDDFGHPMNGARVDANAFKSGKKIILRFRNGLLDGDLYLDGKYILTKPAVETTGHYEYWREGKLHRDNGLPAISTNGFVEKEYWIDGKKQ